MAYWLFKSEPNTWSWDQQVAKGKSGEEWNGVRNYQARNNMRAMKIGDRGFFYHSINEKSIVGVVEVVTEIHPDSTDGTGKWECVDLAAIGPFAEPVSLDRIKTIPELEDMILVKNSRLSVQPVSAAEWRHICKLGKFKG